MITSQQSQSGDEPDPRGRLKDPEGEGEPGNDRRSDSTNRQINKKLTLVKTHEVGRPDAGRDHPTRESLSRPKL